MERMKDSKLYHEMNPLGGMDFTMLLECGGYIDFHYFA